MKKPDEQKMRIMVEREALYETTKTGNINTKAGYY